MIGVQYESRVPDKQKMLAREAGVPVAWTRSRDFASTVRKSERWGSNAILATVFVDCRSSLLVVNRAPLGHPHR
jgi:hypothetical protein